MSIWSETFNGVFFTSISLVVLKVIHLTYKYCYKIKVNKFSCCGIINIERDINNEIKIDEEEKKQEETKQNENNSNQKNSNYSFNLSKI